MKEHRHTSSAFTIVELLVSISIIALLMGILLPAVNGAKRNAMRAQCVTHVREILVATTMYLQSEKSGFPSLNNEPEDGHWQYNYLIWDGRDFEHNFGPLVKADLFPDMRMLYCPNQESAFHQQNTFVNPWPPKQLIDTRAAYGRRPLVTGLDVTRLRAGSALYADLLHTSSYIETGHRSGVNVGFADGSAKFVSNFKLLTNNAMTLPTSIIDNPTILQIWQLLDTK